LKQCNADSFFNDDHDERNKENVEENSKIKNLNDIQVILLSDSDAENENSIHQEDETENISSNANRLVNNDDDDDDEVVCISNPQNSINQKSISKNNSSNNDSINEVDFEIIDKIEKSASKPKNKNSPDDFNSVTIIDSAEAEKVQQEIPESELFHIVSTNKYDKSEVNIKIPKVEHYEKNNWIFTDINDCSKHYHKLDYPHSEQMFKVFSNDFGLKGFRPQQFGAINAALLGEITYN
jgi:hypothetical protein